MNKKLLVLALPLLLLSACNGGVKGGTPGARGDVLNHDVIIQNIAPMSRELIVDPSDKAEERNVAFSDFASVAYISNSGCVYEIKNSAGASGLYNVVLDKWISPVVTFTSAVTCKSYGLEIASVKLLYGTYTNEAGVACTLVTDYLGNVIFDNEESFVSIELENSHYDKNLGYNVYIVRIVSNKHNYFVLYKYNGEFISSNRDLNPYETINQGDVYMEGYVNNDLASYGFSGYSLLVKDSKYVTFDAKGQRISTILEEDADYTYMAYSSLVFQYSVQLSDRAESFDYYDDTGKKMDLVTRVYDYLTGSYKDIDANYVLQSNGNGFYDGEGIIEYATANVKLINNNKTLESHERTFILDKNADLRDDVTSISFSHIERFGKDRFIDTNDNIVYDSDLNPLYTYESNVEPRVNYEEAFFVYQRTDNNLYGVLNDDLEIVVPATYYNINVIDEYDGYMTATRTDGKVVELKVNFNKCKYEEIANLTEEFNATAYCFDYDVIDYFDASGNEHLYSFTTNKDEIVPSYSELTIALLDANSSMWYGGKYLDLMCSAYKTDSGLKFAGIMESFNLAR